MFYAHAWKVRKIQMIIVNVIFAVLGAYAGVADHNILEGAVIWLFGSWMVSAIVSTFTKTGDKVSALAYTVGAAVFSGMELSLSEGDSVFWAIAFTWNAIKASVGMMILAAILVFEFVIFPITTIYYFVKSRQELALV